MKIVVIGGTGLIGSRVVQNLGEHGHEAVPASLETGVNTVTGRGLENVMRNANVVVDVSNSPSFEAAPALEFFETSTRNLLAAGANAGVGHHVALSVVGSDRMPDSGYLQAKLAQEKLIAGSSIPFSIVRSTQFFEFLNAIAMSATNGDTVTLPPVQIAPIAAADTAKAVSRTAMGPPVNGMVEIGGPERFRLDELIRQGLAAQDDPRTVTTDPAATYFGAVVRARTLVPDDDAMTGEILLADWAAQQKAGTR